MRRDRHFDRRRVRQYVTVVTEMAKESDAWETWDRDLEILSGVSSSGALRSIVIRPGSTTEAQTEALDSLAGDLLSPEGAALAKVLIEQSTFDLFPSVWTHYLRRSSAEGFVNRVRLTVAVPLTDDEIGEIRRRLHEPDRKLLLEVVENPEILGGLVIRQGDWRTDLSVLARLQALQAALK